MDVWVAAALIAIGVGVIVSVWEEFNYSIVAGITCLAVMILSEVGDAKMHLVFMYENLFTPSESYSLLTSMFIHKDMFHLLFNMLVLVFIGIVFEQRIGTRRFVILYFVAGFIGTATYVVLNLDDTAYYLLGASGAICGVIGAFARMYPNERMTVLIGFIPLPNTPVWVIVLVIVAVQFLFVGEGVAVEAHLGGLAAGVLLAPLIAGRPRRERVVKSELDPKALGKLATTPQLQSILTRIEGETVPEVRKAWVEDFMMKARCPVCGSHLKLKQSGIVCDRGHLL